MIVYHRAGTFRTHNIFDGDDKSSASAIEWRARSFARALQFFGLSNSLAGGTNFNRRAEPPSTPAYGRALDDQPLTRRAAVIRGGPYQRSRVEKSR